MRPISITLFALALALNSQSQTNHAPSKNTGEDWADALVKWDTDCHPNGCILETDILRGNPDSNNPPDPKDEREYISIYIPVDRETRTPAWFAFHVDPRAQKNNGIFIGFLKTVKDDKSWTTNPDPDGTSRLMFDKCDAKSCVVRVPKGMIEEGKDSHSMNLLDKFMTADFLWILYLRDGKPFRTLVLLSSFQKAYQHLLANELAPKEK